MVPSCLLLLWRLLMTYTPSWAIFWSEIFFSSWRDCVQRGCEVCSNLANCPSSWGQAQDMFGRENRYFLKQKAQHLKLEDHAQKFDPLFYSGRLRPKTASEYLKVRKFFIIIIWFFFFLSDSGLEFWVLDGKYSEYWWTTLCDAWTGRCHHQIWR